MLYQAVPYLVQFPSLVLHPLFSESDNSSFFLPDIERDFAFAEFSSEKHC
jgi:hypothetical protein